MEIKNLETRLNAITTVTEDVVETQNFMPAVEIRWRVKNGFRRYDPCGDTRINAPLPIPGIYWIHAGSTEAPNKGCVVVQPKHKSSSWYHYNEWIKVPYIRHIPTADALYIGARYLKITKPYVWDKKAPFEKREWKKEMDNLGSYNNPYSKYVYSEEEDYKRRHNYTDECIIFKDDLTQAYNLDGTPYGEKGKYYSKGAAELLKKYSHGSNQFYNGQWAIIQRSACNEIASFFGISVIQTTWDYGKFYQNASKDTVVGAKGGKSSAQVKAEREAKVKAKVDLCNNAQLTALDVIDKKYPLKITYNYEKSGYSSYRIRRITEQNEWITYKEGDWVRFIRRSNYSLQDNGDKLTTVFPTAYDLRENYRIYTGGEKPVAYWKYYGTNWEVYNNGYLSIYTVNGITPAGNVGNMDAAEAFEYYLNPHWYGLKNTFPNLYSLRNTWCVKNVDIWGKNITKPTYKKIQKSSDIVEACGLNKFRDSLNFIESKLDGSRNQWALLVLHHVADYKKTYEVLEDLRNRISAKYCGTNSNGKTDWDEIILAVCKSTPHYCDRSRLMTDETFWKEIDDFTAIKDTPDYEKKIKEFVANY